MVRPLKSPQNVGVPKTLCLPKTCVAKLNREQVSESDLAGRIGATDLALAVSVYLPIREAAPVYSRHRVRLVRVQRLNPCLEQIEGGRSDIEAPVSGLVSKGDALSGLVIGAAYGPQHRGGP